MVLIGVQQLGKSNKLPSGQDIGLPLAFPKGSVSVSMSFENHPTGSISIEEISELEIDAYRAAYNSVGKSMTLFTNLKEPLYFEIAGYGETEDAIFIDDTTVIRSYSIGVSLRGGHERKMDQSYNARTSKSSKRLASTLGVSNTSNKNANFIDQTKTQDSIPPAYDITKRVQNGKINLKDFASIAQVPYEGYSYAIEIPKDASEFSTNFTNVLQEKLRLNLQIVDYNSPTVKTRNFRSGRFWPISNQDIIYSVELSKQQPYEYSNTLLTGKDGLPFIKDKKKSLKEQLGAGQERKAPVLLTLEEGDVVPTLPPTDVTSLRSLDMNFDSSGPRKTLKRTKTQNGQPFEEEIFVYGLAYLAQDIRNPAAESEDADFDTPALLGSPTNYWTQIEYQKTTYVYENSSVRISLRARNPQTNETYTVRYLGSTSFDNKYLTSVVTTGWKLSRFQQEQFDEAGTGQDTLDSRWLTDEIAFLNSQNPAVGSEEELELRYLSAQLNSIQFRRIPFKSKTSYRLVPSGNYYDDIEQIPFQTQLVKAKDINIPGDFELVVAVPDPSYVYPMKVIEESTLTQAFAEIDHPQNILIRAERRSVQEDGSLDPSEKEEALRELKLLPGLTTGEDTFSSTLRKVLPSKFTSAKSVGKNESVENDIYVEFSKSASNHDQNFQYSLQETQFRTTLGRLPDATSFSYEYEDGEGNGQDDEDGDADFEYRLDSTNELFVQGVESLSYDTADLATGLAVAKADLELQNFLNVYEDSLSLAWYYPEIRPGDFIEFTDNYSKGKLRVKNCSFQLDFQGWVGEEILVTCSGTNLSCGRFEEKPITNRKVRKNSSDNSGLDIEARVSGEDLLGGNVVPDMTTRRNRTGAANDI